MSSTESRALLLSVICALVCGGCVVDPEDVGKASAESGDTADTEAGDTEDSVPPDPDVDGDGFVVSKDCDDQNGEVNPDAEERCDGVDNDCDGETDEDASVDAPTWYIDYDGDGFGNDAYVETSCAAPDGYIANDGDCDDTDALVSPTGLEVCDGVDNNCDGEIDEGALPTWYRDADLDEFGDLDEPVLACEPPGVDYTADATDCDDTDPSVFPGAPELCDGVDHDCDGMTDEDDSVDADTWYRDDDSDGYGDPDDSAMACSAPLGFVGVGTDCEDADPSISPEASEDCDGVDDDCDGEIDDGVLPTWYIDRDGDGYGDDWSTEIACDRPELYVSTDDDCDDLNAAIYPGATETCDGVDEDCDGEIDGVPGSYDPFADFSATSNPSGVWRYGWSASLVGAVETYDTVETTSEPGLVHWYSTTARLPDLTYNTTGAEFLSGGTTIIPADRLVLHPGSVGEHSHLEWSAPHDGTCDLSVTFGSAAVTTTDVHVLQSATSLWSDEIVGKDVSMSWSSTLTVSEGDTVSFAVGYGSNETYYSDTTSLDVLIECAFTCSR